MADARMPEEPATAAAAPAGESPPWRRPPLELRLDRAVHVWRVDLAAPGERLGELLSEDERERAARFLDSAAGLRWARARGALRALLGRYLERDPRALRFTAGEHGKPALADTEAACFFNLSHSGAVGVYVFSGHTEVGVDVEVAGRERDVLALAARTFGAAAAERLAAVAPASREREFLRLWVRHEAIVKCSGSGIGVEPDGPEAVGACWVAELDAGPRAVAAVAAGEAPSELCCWNVDGPADTLLSRK